MLVYISGVLQAPGIDFYLGKNTVMFPEPPSAGCIVEIKNNRGNWFRKTADGSTYLYQVATPNDDVQALLDDAFKYCDVPAVADLLSKLKVVIELVKQE